MLAIETILNAEKIKAKIPKDANPTFQDRPRKTPKPVATALPPCQLSQRGQICPAKAANPIDICQYSFNSKFLAINTATIPLLTSIKKTLNAAFLPICLKTLVAPVEPEPTSLMSIPANHFPAKYPLGIDPNK